MEFFKEAAKRAALSALREGLASGGVVFVRDMLSNLGDKQLVAVIAIAEQILKSRQATVTENNTNVR